jgi:hypothetical protein
MPCTRNSLSTTAEALWGNADGALTAAERTLMAEWLDRLADRADS